MTFRDSQKAFEQAIREGRLSVDKAQPNYAGNYMYMGTTAEAWITQSDGSRTLEGLDLFKHIETRRYDV